VVFHFGVTFDQLLQAVRILFVVSNRITPLSLCFSIFDRMKLLGIYWLLQALVVSALHANVPELRGHTQIIPSKPFSGNVNANTISKHGNLDGPQLSAVNESSYEWWYFDAVSTDRLSSITIVFYTALASGFGGIDLTPDVTVVGIDFLFPNGTTNSIMLKADEAVITTIGQGASAVFENSGAKWTGTFDLSSYAVEINAPESGVVGTFHLKSLAPAQYVFPSIPSLVKQFLMFSKLCMWRSIGRTADDGGAKRWLVKCYTRCRWRS